jgi:hypothetical protein
MDLTSCFGEIEILFNAEENMTIPWSSSLTLAYIDANTSIAILDQASTSTMPLPTTTSLCFPTVTQLKFLANDCFVLSTKSKKLTKKGDI